MGIHNFLGILPEDPLVGPSRPRLGFGGIAQELLVFGIYEDLYGPSEVGPGTYIILAVVAFMVLRAAPAFLREVLPNFRIYPVIAGGIAFWWLLFLGKFLLAFAAMMVGMFITMFLTRATDEKKPGDPAAKP
jgi:hypothetical protein